MRFRFRIPDRHAEAYHQGFFVFNTLAGHRLSVLREDPVQPIPVQAMFELEALCNGVELLFRLTLEVIAPLLHEELRHQDVTGQTPDAIREFPDGSWIQLAVFFGNLFVDEFQQGLVCRAHVCIVGAPGVRSKSVLFGEEVLEEGDIRRLARDKDHALEADIFVEPDRPAQAVL